MSFLDPESDRSVHAAVDAYLDGRLHPAIESSVAFETENSRYGITDGVVSYASSDSLIGTHLVGWLIGAANRGTVSAWWHEGARAVLVDLRHGRHVIVTSPTRAYRSLTQAKATVRVVERPPQPAVPQAPQISYSSPPLPRRVTPSSQPPAAHSAPAVIPPPPRPARFPAGER